MIFASSHTPYLEVGKKIPDWHKMGASNFGRVYIIFASSDTPYLEVGKKMPDLPQNGGI